MAGNKKTASVAELSYEKVFGATNLDMTQRAFCLEPAKAVRLLAPAGSGKTYSILWRCLVAVRQAITSGESARFLIFTFTRVARDELRDRIKNNSSFSELDGCVDVNTLNAWSYRWLKLRIHSPRLLTSSNDRSFLVSNDLQPIWQQHPALREVLTDSKLKVRATKSLMDKIDFLKGLGFRHDKHTDIKSFKKHLQWLGQAGLYNHVAAFLEWLQDLEIIERETSESLLISQTFERFMLFWCEAVAHLYKVAKISLEDQKYWGLVEMECALKERKFTTGVARYHHIIVDEFQDINALDLKLLSMIAKLNKSELCIVGDDDQAIYEWRGASPDFILNPDDFVGKEYALHILETNYRCPNNIVEYSQRLIKHNQRRVDKNVRAASRVVANIDVVPVRSVEASVEYVLTLVKDLLRDDSIENVALISRKRSQIIPYQIVFAGADIPFFAAEDLNVMLSHAFEELKQLLVLKAQFKALAPFWPDPVESLLKLCDKVKRYPLKKEDRAKVKGHLLSRRPRSLEDALNVFYSYQGSLKGDNAGGKMTGEFYHAMRDFLLAESVASAIHVLSEQFDGLQKDYGKSQDDIFYADPPFLYLSAYAERYGNDYASFYEDVEKAISTLVRVSPDEDDVVDDRKRKLHLMTALRAKGKEFDVVVILDCNQDIWPSKLADTAAQLEAERRVFYVAFTRGKKQVVLMVNDQMFQESAFPSPYIREMGLES